MTKARKQANFRRKIAGLFFILLIINIIMKFFGLTILDDSEAMSASHVMSIKVAYYGMPVLFFITSAVFMVLSRLKSAEAESIEIGGCSF
jgi:hypothetical protein